MEPETSSRWLGRKPKGERDTHSWKAFLRKTPRKALEAHLQRHHKGYRGSSE